MMKAKNTVMKHEQVIDLVVAWRKETLKTEPPKTADAADLVISTAEAQAEISFKAGIKEVVEWITEHKLIKQSDNVTNTMWQVKLKEWGITPL